MNAHFRTQIIEKFKRFDTVRELVYDLEQFQRATFRSVTDRVSQSTGE